MAADVPSSNGKMRALAPRDIALEREWTKQAAASVNATSDRLIAFAEARAGQAPVRERDTRNFGREVLEELADARNYLVWWVEQIARLHSSDDLAGEITEAVGQTLAAVAIAYEHADRARGLSRELLGPAA
jgi:hypothetical protein